MFQLSSKMAFFFFDIRTLFRQCLEGVAGVPEALERFCFFGRAALICFRLSRLLSHPAEAVAYSS